MHAHQRLGFSALWALESHPLTNLIVPEPDFAVHNSKVKDVIHKRFTLGMIIGGGEYLVRIML